MRESSIIQFFTQHDREIKAVTKQAIETAIDLSILKEIMFEKGLITKEEYDKKIKEKTDILLGRVKSEENSKEPEKINEPATTEV